MSFFSALLLVCLLALASTPASAQDRNAVARQFRLWLEDTVWPQAQRAGVSRTGFERALGKVTLDWDLDGLLPPGTRANAPRRQRQAEFGAPARYFSGGVVDHATSLGREMAVRHAASLAAAERATGVPGRIILAIWGRESGYGRAPLPHDAYRVLATRGFMGDRPDYFTAELVAALRIAEAGFITPREMRSSAAGALGQPQFMPSSYLRYAADGDGDRHADIWKSEGDTIASIAAFLARHGWVRGRDWGFEVKVPARVSCALEGPDQGRKISAWEAMGITRVSGRPFPAHERQGVGYLMMPAGRLGPAFLVTPNFYVLKDYNTSDLYALFVGHVGDRIQFGSFDFRGRWQAVDTMLRSDIAALQRALEARGHDVGGADGLPGYKTRRSIGRWQADTGRPVTCFPDRATLAALTR